MKEIQATRGKPRKGKQDHDAPTEVDEDELDPKLPFPMIHPTADWKIYWDLWISACIIWSTLTVPFSIGFRTAYSTRCVPGVFFIDSTVDISFVIDCNEAEFLVFILADSEAVCSHSIICKIDLNVIVLLNLV